jgi:threonylcarbamoyladenosine tRNA methylthiotransferase MtaB
VTIARGPGRSRAVGEILTEVRDLTGAGYREVVVSGVHLGSYGHDAGNPRGLEDLVRRILDETEVPRLRLSSIEPWDVEPRFFALFRDPRLLPHLHLPLQSGCDATLSRMARRGTVAEFRDLVTAARLAIPDLSITTDVMVGFPGETDSEFEESITAVEQLAFARLHIFRYSRREGTAAAAMRDQVPREVAGERSRRLHELGEHLMSNFHRRFLGRRLTALWEGKETLGATRRWSGLTDNYIRVLTETDDTVDLGNRVTEIELEQPLPGAVAGSIPGLSTSRAAGSSRRPGMPLPVLGDS